MDMPLNSAPPEVMHIDLNACFAMTEQQANPLLRGRPVGVTNRIGSWATIIAPSYEAKRLGVKCGTRVADARVLAPGIVIMETEPDKYKYVHRQLKSIFADYAPFAMKSIDEGVLDFRGMVKLLKGRELTDVAREIKQRVREELGEWMTVNIGIAPNRFLAKLAAGFHKPDGLEVLDAGNLELVYHFLDLLDLPGINVRYRRRLWDAGLETPIDFLRAPEWQLTKQVFHSINGRHWYLRLRGYEVDDIAFGIKNVGRQYVLHHRTADPEELSQLLYTFAVKVSRRLRQHGLAARGLLLSLTYPPPRWSDGQHSWGWYERRMFKTPARRAADLHQRALRLFSTSPPGQTVSGIAMTAYGLQRADTDQLSLYERDDARQDRLEDAINTLNDKYGELVVRPARLLHTPNPAPDKISFGSVRYFE